MSGEDVVAPEVQTVSAVRSAAGMRGCSLFDGHDRVVLVAHAWDGGSPGLCFAPTSTSARPLREAVAMGGR